MLVKIRFMVDCHERGEQKNLTGHDGPNNQGKYTKVVAVVIIIMYVDHSEFEASQNLQRMKITMLIKANDE